MANKKANGFLKGINPENKHQMLLFLCSYMQSEAKISGHPQEIMKKLAEENGFKILESVPQSLLDGWDFWIEFDTPPSTLPNIFRDVEWKSVGSV